MVSNDSFNVFVRESDDEMEEVGNEAVIEGHGRVLDGEQEVEGSSGIGMETEGSLA